MRLMYPSQAATPSTALGRPASAINTNRTPKQIETSGPERATRNSAPALANRSLNSATPPNSQRVIESTSIPSRRATHEWPSSWSRIDAKNSRAATIAAPEVRAVGQAGVLRREDPVRQRPDDQGEDRDQAPVEPNLDAAEAADREVPVHRPFLAFRLAADAWATDCFVAIEGLLSPAFGVFS